MKKDTANYIFNLCPVHIEVMGYPWLCCYLECPYLLQRPKIVCTENVPGCAAQTTFLPPSSDSMHQSAGPPSINTVICVVRNRDIIWLGKIKTKDSRGGRGGTAIFSELKIADFPKLCGASLSGSIVMNFFLVIFF